MSKKLERDQAIALRKRGFTFVQIAQYVGVSTSTVSGWFKDDAWSKEIAAHNRMKASRENSKRIALLNKARAHQQKKLYGEAERSAATEFKHYKSNPLFVAGLMLYLSEGDMHNDRPIRLSAAQMEMHHIFLDFTTEYLGVSREKVRFWLHLSPAHLPEHVSRKWAKELHIGLSQFHKYQVIQSNAEKPRLQYGVGNTIIGNAVLKRKLIKWIELMLKELRN